MDENFIGWNRPPLYSYGRAQPSHYRSREEGLTGDGVDQASYRF